MDIVPVSEGAKAKKGPRRFVGRKKKVGDTTKETVSTSQGEKIN